MFLKISNPTCHYQKKEKLLKFYNNLSKEAFTRITNTAKKKFLFGTTCEQLFTKMKYTKSKTRLTDKHLENNLKVVDSSNSPNIITLVKKYQTQISNYLKDTDKFVRLCSLFAQKLSSNFWVVA